MADGQTDHQTPYLAAVAQFADAKIPDTLPISRGIQASIKAGVTKRDLDEDRQTLLILQLVNAVMQLESRLSSLEVKTR
ncbi:hypothetical protein [Mycolicibacterium sp.]|uniref:hypothetical protein n=1 Tax=Mycolicibacterium sp. TaxID=2320850 RepID=UPI0037CA1683